MRTCEAPAAHSQAAVARLGHAGAPGGRPARRRPWSLTSPFAFVAIKPPWPCCGQRSEVCFPALREGLRFMAAPTYEKLTLPKTGTRVTVDVNGRWHIPEDPIICLLRGDGIGRDVATAPGITTCAARVLDAAVEQAYQGKRRLHWFDVHAGDQARELYNPQVKDEQV